MEKKEEILDLHLSEGLHDKLRISILKAMDEYGKNREDKAYKKGWEDATSEAIKEIHENYKPI